MSGKVLITGGAGFIGSQIADVSPARQLPGYESRVRLDEGPARPARWRRGQIAIDWVDPAPWSSKRED